MPDSSRGSPPRQKRRETTSFHCLVGHLQSYVEVNTGTYVKMPTSGRFTRRHNPGAHEGPARRLLAGSSMPGSEGHALVFEVLPRRASTPSPPIPLTLKAEPGSVFHARRSSFWDFTRDDFFGLDEMIGMKPVRPNVDVPEFRRVQAGETRVALPTCDSDDQGSRYLLEKPRHPRRSSVVVDL